MLEYLKNWDLAQTTLSFRIKKGIELSTYVNYRCYPLALCWTASLEPSGTAEELHLASCAAAVLSEQNPCLPVLGALLKTLIDLQGSFLPDNLLTDT